MSAVAFFIAAVWNQSHGGPLWATIVLGTACAFAVASEAKRG